jgi:hypothetical protein
LEPVIFQVLGRAGMTLAMRFSGQLGVGLVALDADEMAAQPLGGRAGGAGAEEGVQHDVAGPGRGQQHPVQQALGLLGRMGLVAVVVLDPLLAGAQGQVQSERIWVSSLKAFRAS